MSKLHSRKLLGMILGTFVIIGILIIVGILAPEAITAQVVITAITMISFLISFYMGTNAFSSFTKSKYFRAELVEDE